MQKTGHRTEAKRLGPGRHIYRQPKSHGRGSHNWYCRIRDAETGRIYTRSTKTSDARKAERIAEQLYAEFLLHQHGKTSATFSGLRLTETRRFANVIDDWLASLERRAGTDPKRLRDLRDKKQLCFAPNGIAAKFRDYDVSTITTEHITEYLAFQVEHSKNGKLAPTTQKNAVIVLRLILKHALGKGLITKIPELPKIRQVDSPRSWFDESEYRTLISKARSFAKEEEGKGDHAEANRWLNMADFIIFMVGSFLRSSEWASLQRRHVKPVFHPRPYLQIAVIKGKTKKRYTTSMPEAAHAFRRICRRTDGTRYGTLEDYAFLPDYPNRQTALERMYDRFEKLLAATKLKRDAMGKVRVIHSLRHTALMFGIKKGVDHFMLAKNAGTSVDQLERFYCSHFTADMNLEELHKGNDLLRS